jgi:RND superfamily putative drug exporter
MDLFANLRATLPYALLVMALTIFVLLFLMTGGVVMPLKAIVLNTLSLTATFGALVWIFQDGHLENLLSFQSSGSIDGTQTILIFALAFGLSMDYEVFLLSRIKEQFDITHDNRASVALGLQRTGWLITSAALLFAVVLAAFSRSEIVFIKQIGVGLAIAVLMDATLVRALLVPATMRLLGRWNWWAPAPLHALWLRIGLSESASAPAYAAPEMPEEEPEYSQEVSARL